MCTNLSYRGDGALLRRRVGRRGRDFYNRGVPRLVFIKLGAIKGLRSLLSKGMKVSTECGWDQQGKL